MGKKQQGTGHRARGKGRRPRDSRSPSEEPPPRNRPSAASLVRFRWQRRPPIPLARGLRALATAALARLDQAGVELGVLVCDDATIRSLNRRFRGRDHSTDVLSFPAGFATPDGPRYFGDVAISLETAVRQAGSVGGSLEREVKVLLLHGLIHLAGYDHEHDRGEMSALESALRNELVP
jgi:probable rRNA maturation factor